MKVKPSTPTLFHLVSLLLWASGVAAGCNRTCGGRSLPFPFGFSDGSHIQLNCSTNGTALAAEFPVLNVTSNSILVRLPSICNRPVEALGPLFTRNYAPFISNAVLLLNCSADPDSCIIPTRLAMSSFEWLDCGHTNDSIQCYSETDNTSLFMDYGNLRKRGCQSLLSAVSVESMDMNDSSVSLDFGTMSLGWWLLGSCGCSDHAKCDVVSPPIEGDPPAYRCQCVDGFVGDGYRDGAGCRKVPPYPRIHHRSRLYIFVVASMILAVIMVIIIHMIITRTRKQKKVALSHDISPPISKYKRISYMELERGTNSFSETNLLGRGGFGSVFEATLFDGLKVAVKVFNLDLQGARRSFDAETAILRSIRHRNLVQVIGCCCNMEFKALILTYMPNGSLDKWLHSDMYSLDLLQRLKIAIDVAAALEYLHHGHTFPVVHCDIKPSNVLLDQDMTAHLADFGISKLFDGGETIIQTQTMATIGYTAPEFGMEGKVSTNGDVYSFGILLLEMFSGKKPTDDMFCEERSLKEWVSEALKQNAGVEIVAHALKNSKEDQHYSSREKCMLSTLELAMKCLAVPPNKRINMIEVAAAMHKIYATVVAGTEMHHPRYDSPVGIRNNLV